MLVAVGEVFQVTVDASQRHQKLCHQEEFIHCGSSKYQQIQLQIQQIQIQIQQIQIQIQIQRHQKLCHQEEFIHCGSSKYQLQESKFTFCSKPLFNRLMHI